MRTWAIRLPQSAARGAVNKATLATQAFLDGEAEALTRRVVELAKGGHPVAPGNRLSGPPASREKLDPGLRNVQARVTGP